MDFKKIIEEERKKDYFIKLKEFIDSEYESNIIYPPYENIFEAFNMNCCKVIIVGQDPYHQPNQAHGLAFSSLDSKTPKSLLNIFKELENDLNIKRVNNNLTGLKDQGVFLLNTILTVKESKPLSHINKGWEIFTSEVIKAINLDESPKVFIFWGNASIKLKSLVTNKNHLIITSPHPSPLSARRGFFGSKPFSKTNEFLKLHNLSEIDWSK